jgi:diguanylate cyclase (GGDEF)-like protein
VTDALDDEVLTSGSGTLATGDAQPSAPATGAMFLRLAGRPDGFILWLRGEHAATVRWAGRLAPKVDAPDALLGPRASFAEWLEEVRGRSAPWRPAEVASAKELARVMPEVVLQRTQSQLVRLALHDPLTGLPNRTLMNDRLVELLAEHPLRRESDSSDGDPGVGLLFIDLDGFKGVNDTRGHLVGDELLIMVARRLVGVVRPQDTVARIGGDEFVIVVPSAQRGEVVAIGERIVEEFRQSFVLGDEVIRSVTASVGITVVPPGTESDEALRQADSAMYHAKRSGRDQIAVYNATSGTAATYHELAKEELQLAISSHNLTVEYEPVMRLVPGAEPVLHGFEALARWPHPTQGRLRPDAFIGVVEDNGLIDALGDAVLHEALRQLRDWHDPRLTMAVNVSVRQLVRPGFAAEVLSRLVELGIEPARLILDARASQLMEKPDAALAGILEVHSTGVHIAIDDFGTGLTSVTYLRDLPAAALKIDSSLVAALSQPGQDRGVVGAIVRLAHGLGMQTIAEGVETEEQLVQVRAVGSDFAQGYLLGEPLPGAAIRLPARGRGGTGRE